MDQSEVERIVSEHLPYMAWDLQVHTWNIKVFYQALKGSTAMQTQVQDSYDQASIFIDCASLEDEADVLKKLRHELIHLMLAPMFIYADFVEGALPKRFKKADQKVWESALERTVRKVENAIEWGYGIPAGRRQDFKPTLTNPYERNTVPEIKTEKPPVRPAS